MFANAITTFSLWLVDILLFIAGIYLVWRCIKLYRLKGIQKENAHLVSKELKPCFDDLQEQIQALRKDIQTLKDEKDPFADSLDTGG